MSDDTMDWPDKETAQAVQMWKESIWPYNLHREYSVEDRKIQEECSKILQDEINKEVIRSLVDENGKLKPIDHKYP